MTAPQSPDSSMEMPSYMISPDLSSVMYDTTSSDSSASSPMTPGFDSFQSGNGLMEYQPFPMQYSMDPNSMVPAGMIPVELDIEGIYEDHDRRRKKNADGKTLSSHVHSRRRAQNRASQRAFRDRKEKHMRELEDRLDELQGQHNDLTRSYDSLKLEYSSVRAELNSLRKESTDPEGKSQRFTASGSWDSKPEALDPLLYDISAFCFDQDDTQGS